MFLEEVVVVVSIMAQLAKAAKEHSLYSTVKKELSFPSLLLQLVLPFLEELLLLLDLATYSSISASVLDA